MKITIAFILACCVGLFAGWISTEIYHAQEDASKKLDDEFHGRTRVD